MLFRSICQALIKVVTFTQRRNKRSKRMAPLRAKSKRLSRRLSLKSMPSMLFLSNISKTRSVHPLHCCPTLCPCVLERTRCRATDSLGQDDLSASCRATSCLTYHSPHRQSQHTTPSTRRDRCGAKHRMSARRCARLTLLLRLRSSPPLLCG